MSEDGELMAAVGAGGVEAFAELYDRYCERAYRVAFAVCRDDGNAQEAVREAFVGVWNGRASYRSQQGTVGAWLLTVVRRRAIDIMRRNGRHESRRALALLPEPQQEVITLAFYGQLSHTEIADHLGLASGTVKGWMRLGLQRLRAGLEQTPA